MSVAKTLGETVRNRGVMISFISRKTGISVDALSKSFAGQRRLSADEMILICNALGLDVHDLIDSAELTPTSPRKKRQK